MLTAAHNGKSDLRGLLERQITADFPIEHKRWALTGYALLVSQYAPQLSTRQRKDLYRYMHDSQRVPRGWIGGRNSAGYEQLMKDKPLRQAYKMLKTNLDRGLSMTDVGFGQTLIEKLRVGHSEKKFEPQPFADRALYETLSGGSNLDSFKEALVENAHDPARLFSLLTLADLSGNSALRAMMQVENQRKARFDRFVDLVAQFVAKLDATQQKNLGKHLSKSLQGPALFGVAPTAGCREVMSEPSLRKKYVALSTALSKGTLSPARATETPAHTPPANYAEVL
jgi:hypothetical protein